MLKGLLGVVVPARGLSASDLGCTDADDDMVDEVAEGRAATSYHATSLRMVAARVMTRMESNEGVMVQVGQLRMVERRERAILFAARIASNGVEQKRSCRDCMIKRTVGVHVHVVVEEPAGFRTLMGLKRAAAWLGDWDGDDEGLKGLERREAAWLHGWAGDDEELVVSGGVMSAGGAG